MLQQHSEHWYKHAVIYELDVETYMDSNGDGVGDFAGLTRTLDYIHSLGVNTLWLLPFYNTPNRDNGYDISDYYNVDSRLGTLGDFVEFMHRARDRGFRVLVDLVINHTSDQHPWFQAARSDPDSRYHDYYIWSKDKPKDADKGVAFPGAQQSIWTYDEKAGAYYYHRFYKFQPDLNIANPDVQEEIRKIMGFWLELGVAGFRVDAAPFVIELKGLKDPTEQDRDDYLDFFRQFLSWRRGDAILLAEANVAMDNLDTYFGQGDRMHMLFDFMLNQHLFAALAEKTADPLRKAFEIIPPIPELCQWAQFLRNHDELNLARLDEATRQKVYEQFAPDEDMRLYHRGIRRRLAPMLNNNRRWLELANSMLLTLPGTPVIRYGQEIGMGDDLSLPERNSVRTPMQWTDAKNGGFSTAAPDQLVRPVIAEGDYSYRKVNVAKQRHDADSLLAWMQGAIQIRNQCPEFGFGDCEVLDVGDPRVFAHRCRWRDGEVVALHNFSDKSVKLSTPLADDDHILIGTAQQPSRTAKASTRPSATPSNWSHTATAGCASSRNTRRNSTRQRH